MARTGAAGQQGPKVRSDCWVQVELREEGGLQVDLASKVAGMYGERIEAQVSVAMFERTARREIDNLAAKGLELRDGLEIIDEAIDGGHRVLVFSQFVTMLTYIREALDWFDRYMGPVDSR